MINHTLTPRSATPADLPAIHELLEHCQLPATDCKTHCANFIVIEDKDQIIGTAGLEIYDTVALLRSLAVIPAHRQRGIGKQLCMSLIDEALKRGITTLYLLTETGETFFSKLHFTTVHRDQAPPSISQTNQFQQLCPASAKFMCCVLPIRNQVEI